MVRCSRLPSWKSLSSSAGSISSLMTLTSVVSAIRRMKSRQAQMSPTSMAMVRSKMTVSKNVTQRTMTSLFGFFMMLANERQPLMP